MVNFSKNNPESSSQKNSNSDTSNAPNENFAQQNSEITGIQQSKKNRTETTVNDNPTEVSSKQSSLLQGIDAAKKFSALVAFGFSVDDDRVLPDEKNSNPNNKTVS